MMKWNNRAKLIASAGDPLYGGFATRDEVRRAKLLARGRYWDNTWSQDGEKDFTEFVSFGPNGRRRFFEYDWFNPSTKKQKERWKKEVRSAARLWAAGKYDEADSLYDLSYNNSHE